MVRPIFLKICGFRMGSTTLMRSFSRTDARAPMSSHVVLGTVTNPSRFELGCTFFKAFSKSAISTERSANCSAGRRSGWASSGSESSRSMSVGVSVGVGVGVGCASRGNTKSSWKMRLIAMMAASFLSVKESFDMIDSIHSIHSIHSFNSFNSFIQFIQFIRFIQFIHSSIIHWIC